MNSPHLKPWSILSTTLGVLILSLLVSAQPSKDIQITIDKLGSGNVEEKRGAASTIADFDFTSSPILPSQVSSLMGILPNYLNPDANFDLRVRSARALGNIARFDEDAIQILLTDITDKCDSQIEICGVEIEAISNAGLKTGKHNEAAVQHLLLIVNNDQRNPDIRSKAVDALGNIVADRPVVVSDLCKILSNQNSYLRVRSAIALGKIGSSSQIKSLVNEIVSTFTNVLREKIPAAKIENGVALITTSLQKNIFATKNLRSVVMTSLVDVTKNTNVVNNDLINCIELEEDYILLPRYAKVFANIAKNIAFSKETDKLDPLYSIRGVLMSSRNAIPANARDIVEQSWLTDFDNEVKDLDQAISNLEDTKSNQVWGAYIQFAKDHNYIISAIIVFILLLWLWLLILWVNPIWLLYVNNALASYSVKIPWFDGLTVHLGYVLIVGFFHYHHRVLDAWVERQVGKATPRFKGKPTVRERSLYIPTGIMLDENDFTVNLKSDKLQQIFSEDRSRISISGEPGMGKTTVACKLLLWAMHADREKLTLFKMLPVLIERNIQPSDERQPPDLLKSIRYNLEDLIGKKGHLSDDFLKKLLINRRLIVAIDGFSEMNQPSRDEVLECTSKIPINSIIFTSRVELNTDNFSTHLLQPQQIESNRLYDFLSKYFTSVIKAKSSRNRQLLDDDNMAKVRNNIVKLADNKPITPLLAIIYADQIINRYSLDPANSASPPQLESVNRLPTNIPDLWLSYITQIHRNKIFDLGEINKLIQHIAWECLRHDFQPKGIPRDVAKEFAAEIIKSKNQGYKEIQYPCMIEYLEKELLLLRPSGPDGEMLRFSIDPLSEYLAGLYLVKSYRDSWDRWNRLIKDVDEQIELSGSSSDSIKGFLQALIDCCDEKGRENKVPVHINEEIRRRFAHSGPGNQNSVQTEM